MFIRICRLRTHRFTNVIPPASPWTASWKLLVECDGLRLLPGCRASWGSFISHRSANSKQQNQPQRKNAICHALSISVTTVNFSYIFKPKTSSLCVSDWKGTIRRSKSSNKYFIIDNSRALAGKICSVQNCAFPMRMDLMRKNHKSFENFLRVFHRIVSLS